ALDPALWRDPGRCARARRHRGVEDVDCCLARTRRRARRAVRAGCPLRTRRATRLRRYRCRGGRQPRSWARDRGAQGRIEPLMRLTWIGHATVVIELDGVRLVTDPVLRDRLNVIRRVSGAAAEVGPVDAVLLSHLHYDHLDLPSLERFRHTVPVFVPAGGAKLLRKRGWTDVVELAEGESASFRDLEIMTTHADHPGRRSPWSDRAAALGYVVSGSLRVYFAGDTDLFPGMSELAPVDVALLP